MVTKVLFFFTGDIQGLFRVILLCNEQKVVEVNSYRFHKYSSEIISKRCNF